MRRGVCVLVKDYDGMLVMVTHKLSNGKFILPGGRLEVNETSFDAAFRELEEETGLRALVLEHVFDMPTHGLDGNDWWTSFFVAKEWGGTLDATREGQVVKWGLWEELFLGPFGQYLREFKIRFEQWESK